MDEPDGSTLYLGARPPKHDHRTLQLANYLTGRLPPPPAVVDWTRPVTDWPMWLNDRIGDCTFASAADMILSWTTNAGQARPVTNEDVLAGYEQVGGYVLGHPETDGGCYELDVLNYWRRQGIGGHRIVAYMQLDHHRRRQIRQAIALFGGVYIGAALPLTARTQFQAGRPWRAMTGPAGQAGSWGGHAVPVLGYARQLTCVTWGRLQRMTWGFWDRYVSEAYAVVSADLLDLDGRGPEGLDLQHLLDDLAAVTAG